MSKLLFCKCSFSLLLFLKFYYIVEMKLKLKSRINAKKLEGEQLDFFGDSNWSFDFVDNSVRYYVKLKFISFVLIEFNFQ